ncbi:hypothetical protein SAMD00019534_094020 [Acytostelium subglobosum LB1]|uniref:hypothetical protein n=2 Tax=Acytostelium subglobosum LB1 TaxID=1410327 RepID=UPI000644D873|nr:hypothetical protein SAMD00019534_094020 [Acytostelium subglobosum LB1]GAM26227.1 hypothetical protein SAMD00019534_094020 [Acytostelium subglobosum LB1]|eukprot:XP_012750781.1 hypothetical protein SAMD00019534_094020 [Acytostelium subglobosum LB1]
MDILSFSDAWKSCVNQTSNFMVVQSQNITVTTNSCPDLNMKASRYNSDPCCNKYAKFSKCCQPRQVTISASSLVGFQTDQLNRQCTSPSCTQSVLQDFHTSSSRVAMGGCNLSLLQYNRGQYELVTLLQQCKDLAYTMSWCDNDTQCPAGGTCSLFTRKCMIPLVVQDRAYVACVLNGSSISTLFNLKRQLTSSSSSNSSSNSSLTEMVYQSFRMMDCTSLIGNNYRTFYVFTATGQNSVCLDRYCPFTHTTSMDYQNTVMYNRYSQPTGTCQYYGYCPGLPGICVPMGNANYCVSCTGKKDFCGICSDQSPCNVLTYNQTVCQDMPPLCVLPNGVAVDTYPERCAELGECTTDCGLLCTGVPKLGYRWLDCNTLSMSECGNKSNRLLCSISPKRCSTREQCEAPTAGSCTDLLYFRDQTQLTLSASMCVRGHTAIVLPFNQPACNINEYDTPFGCVNVNQLLFASKEDCEGKGSEYKWLEASLNQSTCESYKGCLMTDFSNTTSGQSRYNDMTQDDCIQCSSSADMYLWKQKFKWTPGRWLPGVMVLPKWYSGPQTNFVNSSTYGDSFNLDGFATSLSNIMKDELIRSSCQFQGIQDSVEAVSCSCSSSTGSKCFQSTSVPTQSLQVCATEPKRIQVNNGNIQFDATSVSESCVQVTVSEFTRETYASPPTRVPLSAEFFSYKPSVKYGLTNDKGAFIGVIVNNGINVQGPLNHFTLCQSPAAITQGDYTINDLAMTIDNSTNSMPRPIEAKFSQATGEVYICVDISLQSGSGANSSVTLFPILRVADWKDSKEFFTKSQTVLMYILAVIYALCALWGLFQISVIMMRLIRRIEGPKLAHALITSITCYTFIRAIYFFILPTGTLYSSTVSDYVPNIVQDYMKRLSRTIIILNGVLYIACITIILVYNASKSTSSVSFCGTRALSKVSNSTTQTIISLFYGVLQALISLVFGIMFIYLGIKINKLLGPWRDAIKGLFGLSEKKVQLFVVTLSCSFGLIMHSIYVLVLITTQNNWSNSAFSFVFLIITEVFPAITMFIFYNQTKFSSRSPTQSNNSTSTATASYSSKMKVIK